MNQVAIARLLVGWVCVVATKWGWKKEKSPGQANVGCWQICGDYVRGPARVRGSAESRELQGAQVRGFLPLSTRGRQQPEAGPVTVTAKVRGRLQPITMCRQGPPLSSLTGYPSSCTSTSSTVFGTPHSICLCCGRATTRHTPTPSQL